MLLKCFLIFGLVFCLEAASIPKEIPVNVVYLEPADIQENAREKTHVRYLQNRNLDEKVQLSGRELKEADLHIPVQDEPEKSDGKLFSKAKSVFLEKLSSFREQVDGFKLKTDQKKPTSEDWSRLNEQLQEVFKKYEVSGLRQNQGMFAELTQVAGQWFQSITGSNNNPSGQEDEQPANQGGLGQVWTNFQNSVSQAFSNLANNNNNNSNNQDSTTSNTVLGDTGVTTSTRAPGFFQNIVSTVFNNNQGNNPGQEDTGVTSPPNIFQGAINNIISTFNPSTPKPTNAQGDTGASTSAPGNPFFQNIGAAFSQVFSQNSKPPGTSGDNEAGTKPPTFFENVGNVFQTVLNQNNNQNQASTTVSALNSDSSTSAPNINIIQQGLQQFQIPGQNGNNTFASQAQNIGQQFGGNIPGSSGNNQIQQITGAFQNPQNFASQAQNIGQQISGNIPSGSQNNQGVGQQISEAFQNPQNFASQAQNIGQQLSGNGNNNGESPSSSQSSVSNLNVNQIPVIGQQLNQNSQTPLQNLGEQFQAANVINQIQSSTNQIQNPTVVSNNPLNLIDTQNQQLNINQLNQIIPSNSLPGNPLNGSNTFVSNPFNTNQSSKGEPPKEQSSVKPVTEEKVEKKASQITSEKEKNKNEAEIMVANP